jgi:hypothetical protein
MPPADEHQEPPQLSAAIASAAEVFVGQGADFRHAKDSRGFDAPVVQRIV